MGDKKFRDEVISTLRACLLSAQGGISFSKLNSDYKALIGEPIPYRKLGYPSLEDFLTDVNGLQIVKKAGDWNISAIPTEKSAHVTQLIAKQKSTSKRRSRGLTARNRRPAPSSFRRLQQFQTTRPLMYSGRDGRSYHSSPTSHIPPLMLEPQRKPIPSLFDKPPRYMCSNNGAPQTSPTKRLNDRINRTPESTTNNSSPVTAYKNKNAMMEKLAAQQTSTPLPSPVSKQTVGARNTESTKVNATAGNAAQIKPLSERLKSQKAREPPKVLSPLSPSQLVNSGNSNASTSNANCARTAATQPTKNENNNGLNLISQSQNPCDQLEVLTKGLNLPEPIYKIATYGTKGQRTYWGCNIKIGGKSYSSYPQETKSPDEARKVAASKAVKEILSKEGTLYSLSQTKNVNCIKERVKAIVAEHENGVFMNQIPTYYKELYKEKLPEDWEKIIEECSDIFKEKGAHDSTILCPYVPRSEAQNESDKISEALSPRLEKIQLSPIGPAAPGIIKPPGDTDCWDVYITSVLNTADIWARLIDEEYSEQFEVMVTEMETYYRRYTNASGSSAIDLGQYYAVQDQETWHRVRCLDFDPRTGQADVFFIDHGDEDNFHYSKLFRLEKKFCRVPAQAINLSLADLEEFSDCYEVTEYLEMLLLGQKFIARVVSQETIDKDEWVASVELFDTTGPTDINLNEVLLKTMCENILAPKLKQAGQISEVYVSHATDSGDVYLHVKSDSMRYLVNLTNKLIQTGLTNEDVQTSTPKQIITGQIYFARCFEDGNWYRGVVTSAEANNKVKVLLVDFGKTIVIDKKSHLLVLDQLSEVLAKYPPQALKVRLHDIPDAMFNSETVAKLAMLAPSNQPLLVKVITPAAGSRPAVVELFKRTEPENLLVSINHNLAITSDLIGSNSDGNNNNTRPRRRLERTVSRHGTTGDGELVTKNLKPPKIPGFGEYFDVHITMAANPGNFTVQPYDDRVLLEAMMVQLQEVCVNYNGPPPSFDTIKEGRLYAAKHLDSHYYRVCVSEIINEQMVTVYFCDFGDYSYLTLDKLQPLGRQFLELPYQAIRARLVGIQPINIDWSVEDCLRFRDMVVENNFVSIVVDSGADRLSPGEIVLGLKLIDVSGSTDVNLGELFVTEGRAIATEV